jgi:hypothetical protein
MQYKLLDAPPFSGIVNGIMNGIHRERDTQTQTQTQIQATKTVAKYVILKLIPKRMINP